MKINVAVIGLGYWGPNLLRNFNSISGTSVECICDKNKEKLKKALSIYPNIRAIRDYKHILNDPNVDAVSIATPARTHFDIARDCLLCGKHVLVEKPLVLSLKEAEKLSSLAKKSGLTLMVGHTFLYHTAISKVKDILDKKRLGKIYYISFSRLNLGLLQKDINVIWDLAPHDISILNYVMDVRPQEVSVVGRSSVYKEVEDIAMATLKYSDGMLAHMHFSWIDPVKTRKLTIVGSKKMLVFDDIKQANKIAIHDKRVELPRYFYKFKDFKFAYKYGESHSPKVKNAEPLKAQCEDFIRAIVEKKEPIANNQNGIDVIKVVEAMQKSIKKNGKWEKIKW